MKNKMLLVLYPDTFIWEQDNKTLMYNCSSKQTYPFEAIHPIDKYCQMLTDMQNLYVVEIREEDMENPVLKEWVRQIMDKKMGFVKEQEEGKSHIISFPPILNLQSDVDRIEKQEGRDIGEYAAQNWNECTLFMGGESEHPQLYKQLHYPVDYNGHLDFYALQRFFRGADHSYLHTINLVGDVFSYPYKAELMDILYSMSAKKHFYLTEACATQFMEEIKALDLKNYELHIYCEGVGKPDGIHQELKAGNIPFQWVYLLSDEAQTEKLEQLETLYGEENIEVRPIFTGENISFFENHIYLTEEEVMQPNCDKQDVFAHQVMNTNFWGRLSILPDGNVYSNLNLPPLGNLEDRLYDLIVDEMKSHRAWRWTRDEITPCKDCLFRYLCPSPSNYELVIGKPNLCHIKS